MLEKNIKLDNDSVTIFFDTKIYPMDAIMKASELFSENFWVLVDGNKEDTVFVKLTPKSETPDMNIIALEFYNFVLGMIRDKDF